MMLLSLCVLFQMMATSQPLRRSSLPQSTFSAPVSAIHKTRESVDQDTWKKLGIGKLRDDFFTTYYLVECMEFEVEVEESESTPGYYRLVTPYANYPYSSSTEWEEETYMYVNATDPEHVFIEFYDTGHDMGANDGTTLQINSVAGYRYTVDGNLEQAIEEGSCGTLMDGAITFPIASLLVKWSSDPSDQWRYANYNGQFRLKLPGAPELDAKVWVNGMDGTDKVSVHVEAGESCDSLRVGMFSGDATVEMVESLMDGTAPYQLITGTDNVSFDYTEDGIYTFMALPYYNGEPKRVGYITTELDYLDTNWKSVGQAYFTEAFLADSEVPISDLLPVSYYVDVEESTEQNGLFRLVDPYGENYPYSNSLTYDNSRHYYMVIDASDRDCVSISQMEDGCGYDMGYGRMVLWSKADRELTQNGKTKEEVKALGYFGKLEGDVITFPINALLVRFIDVPNTSWYWANQKGHFQVTLPQGVGVKAVAGDTLQGGEPVYYNLQGIRMGSHPTTSGIYVVREGNQSRKVIVK